MSKKDQITAESSIRYHEANLASMIERRNSAEEKAANGEYVSEYFLERIDGSIADTENIIHNWRTKGRGYD